MPAVTTRRYVQFLRVDAPSNTVAPAVTGTAAIGSLLSSTSGTWTDDGIPAFTYQWTRNGSNIGSATAATYTLVSADGGKAIVCVVTNTDTHGATAASSNTVNVTASSRSQPVPQRRRHHTGRRGRR